MSCLTGYIMSRYLTKVSTNLYARLRFWTKDAAKLRWLYKSMKLWYLLLNVDPIIGMVQMFCFLFYQHIPSKCSLKLSGFPHLNLKVLICCHLAENPVNKNYHLSIRQVGLYLVIICFCCQVALSKLFEVIQADTKLTRMTLRLNQTLRSLAYVKLNFNLPSAAWYELNPQKLRTN